MIKGCGQLQPLCGGRSYRNENRMQEPGYPRWEILLHSCAESRALAAADALRSTASSGLRTRDVQTAGQKRNGIKYYADTPQT
jgi:hypothetical protein